MTRLKKENIRFVKMHYIDDKFRYCFVSMVGGLSQCRQYNTLSEIPKTVKDFCAGKSETLFECNETSVCQYTTYIYK